MGRHVVGLLVVVLGFAPGIRADDYILDAVHSAVTFKVGHLGVGWIHVRFNQVSGSFTIAGNQSAFTLSIKADSIDTGIAKRDGHLRSGDFFNVKQFPLITFKSTAVKAVAGGYEVSGDLNLHGVSKSITMTLMGGKTAQFPPGTQRTGFTTQLSLKRTDYGMDRLVGPAGDEVRIDISFEGVKK